MMMMMIILKDMKGYDIDIPSVMMMLMTTAIKMVNGNGDGNNDDNDNDNDNDQPQFGLSLFEKPTAARCLIGTVPGSSGRALLCVLLYGVLIERTHLLRFFFLFSYGKVLVNQAGAVFFYVNTVGIMYTMSSPGRRLLLGDC